MSKIVKSFRVAGGSVSQDLVSSVGNNKYATVLADPPWQFQNRTGKVAPEHKRLLRYPTMTFDDIYDLPVSDIAEDKAHLYLWVPNALIVEGLETMRRWGFTYKTNLVWYKVRKDGGPDGRGVGFYFRNLTELVLVGVKGSSNRTLAAGRRQVNLLATQKREHSRKPDELYDIVESCSPGPYIELFCRHPRNGWDAWGNEIPLVGEVYQQHETIKQMAFLEKRAEKCANKDKSFSTRQPQDQKSCNYIRKSALA